METSVYDFHEKLYIPEILMVAFNFPRVRILGTQYYVKEIHEALKY